MSKENQFSSKEVRLGLVAVDAGFSEGIQSQIAVLHVFLHSLQPYDDVIKVDMANFAYVLVECVSHPMLVCCGGITATLLHDSPHIKSPWCPHSSEVNVIWVHPCLEEGICYVNFSKNLSLPAVSEYVVDAG